MQSKLFYVALLYLLQSLHVNGIENQVQNNGKDELSRHKRLKRQVRPNNPYPHQPPQYPPNYRQQPPGDIPNSHAQSRNFQRPPPQNQRQPNRNNGRQPGPGQFRPPPQSNLHGYQPVPVTPGEISIYFINKSGRRIRMFQSSPYGYEIRFQFTLRPNEPRRVSYRPDTSFWVAYDSATRFPMLINGQHRLEAYYLQHGSSTDAKISSRRLRPERIKRDRSVPRFVETQVIVDKSVLMHHGEDKVMNYTILLMNMVTRTFLHRSFSAPIYISVVNIHLMKEKPSYYRIVPNKPEISVTAACRYGGEITKLNDTVDFNLILTREDIGPSGFASLYTMCSKRSCALVKENGPDSAFVIAHELSHALGIDHDEDDTCVQDNVAGGNIMVKKLYATSSNYQWSRCSSKMIWQNLKYFNCLKNKPKIMPSFKSSLDWLPGELMDAREQCQHYHGSQAVPCGPRNPISICKYLWCRPRRLAPCMPVWWHSPLEGTTCARERWCKRGRCIKKVKIIPVDGGWSKFSEFWPECNLKSTNWVVQQRNRTCTNPRPRLSGKKCKGVAKENRVLLPTKNGICKPYTLRNLVLNNEIDLEKVRQNGCGIKDPTNATSGWRVYKRTEQMEQISSINLTCNFESRGGCGWKSLKSEKTAKGWNIGQGDTPSGDTGPSFDHTYGNTSGHYLYFESSWASGSKPLKKGSRVVLETPLIMAAEACLKFAYHMFGRSIGSLEVYIRRGKHFKKLWSKKGEQGSKWHLAEVELKVNIEYKITIEAVRGSSYFSDIAIDDVELRYGLCETETKSTKANDEQSCSSVCIDSKKTKMVRKRLPNGYPCKLPKSKNNVCFEGVCQPVNCHGIINGRKC